MPAPLGGAIVVGESVLTYFNTQQPTRSTQINANIAIQVNPWSVQYTACLGTKCFAVCCWLAGIMRQLSLFCVLLYCCMSCHVTSRHAVLCYAMLPPSRSVLLMRMAVATCCQTLLAGSRPTRGRVPQPGRQCEEGTCVGCIEAFLHLQGQDQAVISQYAVVQDTDMSRAGCAVLCCVSYLRSRGVPLMRTAVAIFCRTLLVVCTCWCWLMLTIEWQGSRCKH